MNCPKCGSVIQSSYQFCMNCGFSLVPEEPAGAPDDGPEAFAEGREDLGAAPDSAAEAEAAAAPEHAYRRRRAPQAPGSGEAAEETGEKEDTRQEPERIVLPPVRKPAPAREPEPAPPRAEPPRAPAPAQPETRHPQPAPQQPQRPAGRGRKDRRYKRGSGRGVLFWVGMLVLVLAAVYVGFCILVPDHEFTAPAVNLALTVWHYFEASGKYLLWFPIALGAVILLAVLRVTAGRALRRKIHASDLEEARELANRVVVAETLAPPQQIYAEIAEVLESRKLRKQYFPKGKLELEEFSGVGVPLDYSCGADHFTANFVFQRIERAGTRVFLEIIEWQLVNDMVSRRCLQAMRGMEPMLRETIQDIDNSASFQAYDR